MVASGPQAQETEMKLNKTETKLIEKAKESRHSVVSVEAGSFRGPQGGIGSFGHRDLKAANSLIQMGLMVERNRNFGRNAHGNGGHSSSVIVVMEPNISHPFWS